MPVSVVWIDGNLACEPEAQALLPQLAESSTIERISVALRSDNPAHRRRAISAIHDRLALHVALEHLLSERQGQTVRSGSSPGMRVSVGSRRKADPYEDDPLLRLSLHSGVRAHRAAFRDACSSSGAEYGIPNTEYLLPRRGDNPRPTFSLSHTSLGQPVVSLPDGSLSADLHVSFSHDGPAHVCLLAQSPELRGVGIDVVHLSRLRGRSDDYLMRFAGKFMSDDELRLFRGAAEGETGEALLRRVSAHFSLMESASKALGTGLKIGAGMGKPESLPKQSLGISFLEPEVRWLLGPEVEARCRELNAARLEGHWATDEEYGVSAVLLFAETD